MYIVYKHTNLINKKVYIGITSHPPEHRWRNGKGYSHNPHFDASIIKYGWENFSHEILCENLSKEEAELKEIELIRKYNSNNEEFGYNLTSGGGSGTMRHSESSKKLMSINTSGEKNPMYNKKHSKETKEKISNKLKNHKNTSTPVLCIETNITYESTREAERQTGINHNDISLVCRNQRKSAGKLHWRYVI